MTLKDYAGAAPATSLVAGLSAGDTTFAVVSASGYPPGATPFVVAIRRGTATEEKILCTRVGITFTAVSRGYDGTLAAEHPAGSSVEHVLDALTVKEANAHANAEHLSAAGVAAQIAAALPAGVIMAYGGTSAPSGWLLCNGGVVSRTTYAGLFAVLGTRYGAGDGSTTFGLPDLRNRIPYGHNLPADAVVSTNTGSHSHGSASGNMSADHTHAFSAQSGGVSANHTHTAGVGGSQTGVQSADHSHSVNGSTGTVSANHNHTIAVEGTIPVLTVNFIVKT